MADDRRPAGFVPLKAMTAGRPDPASALAEIRQIYFKTTRRTIDNDFAHAIDLLKSLPSEEEREKATVYMEGLAQMRNDWAPKVTSRNSQVASHKSKSRKPKRP